jgi:hypothetical protein
MSTSAPEERRAVSVEAVGIHWKLLDEDLSVRGLLLPQAHALRKSA